MNKNKKSADKRQLSKAEQKRQARFDRISENMVDQGYRRNDLTINILAANVLATLMFIPLAAVGIFTPNHFKDIEFGFMKSSMTPYCACLEPLGKAQYIFGALMPLILLGIVPMIAGIIAGNSTVLAIGIVMADAAAGDIMVVREVLRYKSTADEVVYMDHPTEAGGVIFEK